MGAASCQSAPLLQEQACPVEVLGVLEVQEEGEPQALETALPSPASPQVAAED